MSKRTRIYIFAAIVFIILGATGFYLAQPKRLRLVNQPAYTIITDNRETRTTGKAVTCFILQVDGKPVNLSCVVDAPIEFLPFDEIPVEPGTETGAGGL